MRRVGEDRPYGCHGLTMDAATTELKYYTIHDLPERMRPREEVERRGVEHVSDAVLLAIILRSGARRMNVVDLAEALIRKHGSLTALARVSVDALASDPEFMGLGKVKAQVLKAALELARRMAEEARGDSGSLVRSPEEAAAVLREAAKPLDRERFWALLLDAKNRLKAEPQEISRGILDASLVHPREVFQRAVLSGCAAVILVHNHPSGDPSPSAEDLRITRQLVQAGEVLGIRVLDHVILGRRTEDRDRDYLSLRESGTIDFVK